MYLVFFFNCCRCGDIPMKGSTIWYLQRWSAVFIFIYITLVTSFIFFTQPITFDVWNTFTQSLIFKLATSLTFLSILVHAYLGLWTIGTDYLTPRTLGFLSLNLSKIADSSRLIYNIIFSALGLFLYFYLLFLIWI